MTNSLVVPSTPVLPAAIGGRRNHIISPIGQGIASRDGQCPSCTADCQVTITGMVGHPIDDHRQRSVTDSTGNHRRCVVGGQAIDRHDGRHDCRSHRVVVAGRCRIGIACSSRSLRQPIPSRSPCQLPVIPLTATLYVVPLPLTIAVVAPAVPLSVTSPVAKPTTGCAEHDREVDWRSSGRVGLCRGLVDGHREG